MWGHTGERHSCGSGAQEARQWVDRGKGQLHSNQDNTVTVAAWNFDAGCARKVSIKRDETISRSTENSGVARLV